jgi:putative cell wall-binding protein
VEGIDRYATSVEICNAAFPGGTAPAAVLASGQDYADALTGSAVAGAAGGPLLLTAKDRLPDSVAREVRSLAPSKVYIMGGTAAVSASVEESVRSLLPSAEIVRLAGANRYDTSVLAAREVESLTGVTKAIVVSGSAWADGAAISGLAYARRYPILLTATDRVPGSVSAFFADAKPAATLIAGGTSVVTGGVATTIADLTGGDVTRLAGADRYHTSSAIARHSVDVEGFGYGQVYLATGATYADALSGGVLAGVTEQPILLTRVDSCPGGTQSFLLERKAGIAGLTIFGGPSAVSIDGLLSLDEVMR